MADLTSAQFSVRLPSDLIAWIDGEVAEPTSPYGNRADCLRHLVKQARSRVAGGALVEALTPAPAPAPSPIPNLRPEYDYFPLFLDSEVMSVRPNQTSTLSFNGPIQVQLSTSPFDILRGMTRLVGLHVHMLSGNAEDLSGTGFQVGGGANLFPAEPMLFCALKGKNGRAHPDRRQLLNNPLLVYPNSVGLMVRASSPMVCELFVVVDRNVDSVEVDPYGPSARRWDTKDGPRMS